MTQNSDTYESVISRRSLLAVTGSVAAGAAWYLQPFSSEPAGVTAAGSMCPTDEELEDATYIRGQFSEYERQVVPGRTFRSTLEIVNHGGIDGYYRGDVRLEEPETEEERAMWDSVDVDVPAEDEVTAEVVLTPPLSFDGGYLAAPMLGSTCDLIMPAHQKLEVA